MNPDKKSREELRKDTAREWKKLIAQGWLRSEEGLDKKESLGY